jgi:hypothetical protein
MSVEVMPVVDLTEHELLSEFAKVMHEWGFAPFRRGELAMPTLHEARAHLAARSKYNRAA